MYIVRFLSFIFLFNFCVLNGFSQHSDGMSTNLPNFYKTRIHFGFTISGNFTDFRIHTVKNSSFPDTVIDATRYQIKSVYTQGQAGFALGIVADLRIHEYLRLRFTPNISFASRSLQYTMQNSTHDSTKVFTKIVESTFLIFPLELKLQSKRMGNFSAYVIGGGGLALDLASNKRTGSVGDGNQLDDAVKIKREDYFYSAGGGVDFYLPFFKLGLEIKILNGTNNLLYKENSIFTKSVDKVNSQMVVFSITFEG